METNERENTFPLTEDEILINFEHVFNNNFMSRAIIGSCWKIWHNKIHDGLFTNTYTKGYCSAAELLDSKGEIDTVWFWKYHKHGRIQYGYSFKKRELIETIN